MRGRRDVDSIFRYYRDEFPGFENAHLAQTGPQIGVRETLRIMGEKTLLGQDIRAGGRVDDAVAVGCWPIDVHPPEGEVGVHGMYVPLPYGIPYGCLVPRGIQGLLVSGRCISADREALGSARVGATCAALGQAAGLAAALSAANAIAPRDLETETLRGALRSQGAVVDPPTTG